MVNEAKVQRMDWIESTLNPPSLNINLSLKTFSNRAREGFCRPRRVSGEPEPKAGK